MNHREPPQKPVGPRRVLRYLSLLLLPAMAPESVFALSRPRPVAGQLIGVQNTEPNPYLPAIGPPPLRFQEISPPPDLVSRPPGGAPPMPSLSPTESSVAMENSAAARSTINPVHPQEETPAPAVKPELMPKPAAPAKAPPPAILPDDTHQSVRNEDFLPYFQIPGAAPQPGDVNLLTPVPRLAPAPAPLPPSSATYTQSK